jgi:uroporphyrinogen decarboxylase
MPQTSRELVKELFEFKKPNRPPFMPWVCSFAAKLEQVPVRTMLSDAGVLSRALSNAHKLFGYDVILNHFDLSLEAEACGCEVEWPDDDSLPVITGHPLKNGGCFSDLDTADIEKKGRIPVILEATKRLVLTKGREVPVAAMITGPLTLSRHLRGDALIEELGNDDNEALDLIEDTGSLCLKLCRAYCELGVDMVVLAENTPEEAAFDLSQVLASPLKSIFNVADYYKIKTTVICRVWNDGQAAQVFDLGADAVVVSGGIDPMNMKEKALEYNRCFSINIPDAVFLGSQSAGLLQDTVKSGEKGLFLSSGWEVPCSTNVNSMHEIMKIVRVSNGS